MGTPGPWEPAGDVVERLDAHVREQVRREGVVRDHDQLSLAAAVAPLGDPDAVVGELVARVSGLGPLQPYLDDPEAGEISAERAPLGRQEVAFGPARDGRT